MSNSVCLSHTWFSSDALQFMRTNIGKLRGRVAELRKKEIGYFLHLIQPGTG